MPLLTPGEAVDAYALASPSRAALTDDRESLSWQQLALRSRLAAGALVSADVGRGDLVAIALGNGNGLFVATIAALRIGAVPMPISPKLAPAERAAILAVARPRHLIEEMASLLAGTDAPFTDDVEPPFLKASMSGGSTGRPKVILSKQPGRFDPNGSFFPIPLGGTHLIAAPCSNSGPFTLGLLALLRGTHLVIEPRFDAQHTLEQIDRYGVDFVFLVPTMMARIIALPAATRAAASLASLQSIAHAGAKCGQDVKRAWIDWLGPDRVQEFYAGTEAQGSTWITGREWLDHPGSVGRPSAGCEVRIRDPQGDDCPPGQVGDIFMRPAAGPGSSYAYLGAEPQRAADGFESIGDLGWFDEDGYLYIADRRLDLILRGGTNIYPAELELALETHPAVRSAVVIGLPDADLGQRVHALIEPSGEIDEAELRRHAAALLSAHKLPTSYEFIAHPLRDEGGKVRRSQYLQERLGAEVTT